MAWRTWHRREMLRAAIAGNFTMNVKSWQIKDLLEKFGFVGHGAQLDARLAMKVSHAVM